MENMDPSINWGMDQVNRQSTLPEILASSCPGNIHLTGICDIGRMPGIVMEKGEDETEREGKLEDIASPQRSILDFFKSPTKAGIGKPKDLLGFFSKTQENGSQQKTTAKTNGNVNGFGAVSTTKENTNDLNSSLSEFEIGKEKAENNKPRKGTKKQLKNMEKNDKEEKQTSSDSIKKDNENKKKTPKSEKDMMEACKEHINDEGNKSDQKKKNKPGPKPTKHSKSNLTEKERSKQSDQKIKDSRKDGTKASESTATEKSTDTRAEDGNKNQEIQTAEMNYMDFLKTLGNEEGNGDLSQSSKEKSYPSVSSFFTKLNTSNSTIMSDKQASPNTVTTKADIHFEPTPVKLAIESKSSASKMCINIEDDVQMNEIEILSSEVVTVASPARSKVKTKIKTSKSARKSLTQQLEETNKTSCDVPESNEATEKKKLFLQSSNTTVPVQKTSQATLSFGKGGFQMSNKFPHNTRVRKPETDEELCDSPLSKSTPVKRGRGRPPGSMNKKKKVLSEDLDNSQSEKLCIETSTVTEHETANDVTGKDEKAPNRRSARNKYKVDMISIDSKNRTPIRMRLTRCNKSGSSADESFVAPKPKPNLKQAKAQKLLEKAKKVKKGKSPILKTDSKKATKKKKSEKNKNKDEGYTESVEKASGERRRSSRLTDKLSKSMNESKDDEVMIIDVDDSENNTKKSIKKARDLNTPTKGKKSTPSKVKSRGTPGKGTPKKATGKLAPIFMKKKAGDKEEEPKKPVLDPEQERVRREFLMSGVPDALKKQTAAITASVVLADLPPFPSIRHVQQSCDRVGTSGLNVWGLSNIELKYKPGWQECQQEALQLSWRKCLLEKEKLLSDLSNLKTFKQHAKIEESMIEPLLREIQRTSPSYNVDKMYQLIKEKKDDQDAELSNENEDQAKDEKTKTDKQSSEKGDKSKSKRRSLRLKKKDEIMEVIDLGSPEAVKDDKNSGDCKQEIAIVVPWPDKYQPTHSSEIVGNSNSIKKLKTWLEDWKHKVDKEAKKMKKLMMKESKNKAKEKDDDWWADDDSDFDGNSDESEDDEDRLCNTVMLMGPTGVGKTTAVYALAQELGFKVFEVNASSIRNGKRILSQLQEATQSHRVSHNKCEGGGPASILSLGNKPSPLKKKQDKNLPTSFANFFKKAPASTPPEACKTDDSKSGRKRKRDPDDVDIEKTPKKKKDQKEKGVKLNTILPPASNQTAVSNQGLNLASTSLILFEDVDIVFDEDKGFWSAIQSFMNSTKIPIILTTNDVTLSSKFDGRYEQYLFKTPSLKQTTVYLQLICLTEGIRTNSEEIMTLVKVLKGDIRRLLLALQYWIESGGGTVQEIQKIISPVRLKPFPVGDDSCSIDVSKSKINESSKSKMDDEDDDFVSIKPPMNKRKRQIISDDDSSNSAQPFPSAMDVSEKALAPQQAKIHLSCLNSSLGLSLGGSKGIINLLKQLMKGDNEDIVSIVTEACDQYRKLMYNIVYNTYAELLPLPKSRQTTLPKLKSTVKEKKTQLKRIRTFDLYDSEASNDGFLDSPKEETVDDTKMELSKEEKIACIKSLDNFSEFYDNMSFIDSITLSSEVPDSSNSFILHSKRCLHDTNTIHSFDHIDKDNLCSEIEVRALYKMCTKQRDIQQMIGNQHVEACSIPSVGGHSQGVLVNRANNSTNLVLKKASNNVMTNMPLTLRCHTRMLVMDYMPTLREISKAEKLREIAKAKRRFHHYFDNIGLNLKDTTLDVLLTSFQ